MDHSFLKVGGQLIALKAAAVDEELADAKKNALNSLFAKPILNENYRLPNGMDVMSLLSIRKRNPYYTHVVLEF